MADFSAGYIIGIILSGIIMLGIFVFLLSNDGRIVIQKSYADELTACKNNLIDAQSSIGRACPEVKCSFPSWMYVFSITMILISGGIYIWTLHFSSKMNNDLDARESKVKERERLIEIKEEELRIPLPPKKKKV